jgi:hypothetical protein
MAKRLLVAYSIVLQYLHESLWFKSFHLHWVPHLLTDDLREKPKENARAILPFLHAPERDGWHHLVTGDESWFFYNISPRRIWMLSRDDVVTQPRHDIQSQKFMFTIIWNTSSFYVVDRVPNHSKMNNAYFVTNLLIAIQQATFPGGRALHERHVVFISTVTLFTEVGFQQIGLKNTVFSACHAHRIHLTWPLVTSTRFLQSKKNSNGFSRLTRTSFWVHVKGFERCESTRIEHLISGLGAPMSRSKWGQWRLRQMINNFYI